jgi:hypothetical protein
LGLGIFHLHAIDFSNALETLGSSHELVNVVNDQGQARLVVESGCFKARPHLQSTPWNFLASCDIEKFGFFTNLPEISASNCLLDYDID